MNLSEIKFTVETAALDSAIAKLGQLKGAATELNKNLAATKQSVQIQREEIKLAKEQEKLKQQSAATAEKMAKAIAAEAKANKESGKAVKESVDDYDAATRMVEKQTLAMKILRGETWDLAGAQIALGDGFTKSQSNQLANLKLLGATATQMQVLADSFNQYNAVSGVNTFDKSAGALSKMKKEIAELTSVQSMMAANTALTKDEIVGLAREEIRLTQQWLSEKKTVEGLDKALSDMRKEYTALAVQLNSAKAESEELERQAKAAARQQIKDAKDIASANQYVEKELEKVRFALAETNKEFTKGSANAILRFENAMKNTGKTAEEQKRLIDEYTASVKAMQKASNNRAADTISRAIGPQLTDIVVGLATGQSPMMILLQQGGQLRDQFALAGVEAKAMGDAMKKAGREMVSSIYNTGKAVGQFLVGSFVDAGKAITVGFANKAKEGVVAMKVLQTEMVFGKGSAEALEAALLGSADGFGKVTSAALNFIGIGLGATLFAGVSALIAFGVALRQVIKEEDGLTRALYLTNTGLGMSQNAALEFASSLKSVGVGTSEAIKALSSVKDASYLSRDALKSLVIAAVELERVGGPAISDTMSKIGDFSKEPVAALREVGKSFGFITESQVEAVRQLEKTGDTLGAASLAAQLASNAMSTASKNVYNDLSPLTQLTIDVKKSFSDMWEAIKGPTRKEQIDTALKMAEGRLATLEANGMGWMGQADDLRKYIALQKEVLKQEKEYYDKQEQNKKDQSTLAEIERRTGGLVLDYKKELIKNLDKESYVNKRLAMEYKTADQNRLLQGEARIAQLRAYEKEWESFQKKESGGSTRQVKDNSLQTEKQMLQDILSEKKKSLADQLAVMKGYRENNLISEEQYYSSTSRLFDESLDSQKKSLETWYTTTLGIFDKMRANAKGNGAVLANINRQQDAVMQSYLSMSNERASEVFKFYSLSALDAVKSMTEFNSKLKEIKKEEDKLAASRADDKKFGILSLYTDPDQLAGMKAFAEEQARVNAKIKEQEDILSKRKGDRSAVENLLGKVESNDLEGYVAALGMLKTIDAESAQAAANLEALKLSLKLSPEEMKKWAELQGSISRLNESQSVVRGLDVGSTIAVGFDAASAALGGFLGGFNQLIQMQEDYNKLKANGPITDEEEAKLQRARISQYAKLAGATKGYFKEHTTGYKVLSATEKTFRAIELAETLKVFATKIGLIEKLNFETISGYVQQGAAAMSSAGTSIAALLGIGQTAGAVAPVVAAAGTPGPAAFAAFAAMTALVAAAGFGAFSGSAKFAPTNEGTGTVLGDASAKSESLGNSLERLLNVDTMTMKYSSAMQKSLQNIEYNTAGMGNLLVRSGSLTGLSSGVNTGTTQTNFERFFSNSLAGGMGLASAMQALFSKLAISKVFKTSVNVVGSGISAEDQSIGSILSGGFQASNYADVQTKKKAFGMTYSSKSSTLVSEADQLFESQVTQLFKNLTDIVSTSAPVLGKNITQDILNGYKVSIGRVNLQGLSGEDLIKKLEAVFSTEGDKFAQAILPGLEDFQKIGEGYLETVVRVSSGIEEANYVLDKFGINAVKYTDIIQKQGDVSAEIFKQSVMAYEGLNGVSDIIGNLSGSIADLEETYKTMIGVRDVLTSIGFVGDVLGTSLIKGAGGLDKLSESTQSFFDNYLTESEQIAATTSQLTKEFAKLGLSLPTGAEGFVSLVKGIDTSTESGKELLGRVLGLSDAFSVLADNTAKIASQRKSLEEEMLKLQGNTTELRRRELEALDPSNRALQEQIWLLEDQNKVLEDQKKATEALTNSLKQAGKTIADEIKRLLGYSTSNNPVALQAQFAMQTANARAGNIDSLNSLVELSKSIDTATLGTASSQVEVDRMRAWLAGSLAETMKTLGITSDDSGNISVGSSLTGSTSGSVSNPLIIDNTNQALLTELKTLNAKVADLEAAAVATALSNSKMQKLLDRVASDGNNFNVVVNTEAAPVQVQTV